MLVWLGVDPKLDFTSAEPALAFLVDPTEFHVLRRDDVIIHSQANAHSIDETLDWYHTIDMTIEEDQLMKRILVGSGESFIRDLIDSWSSAKYRFMKADQLNGGVW